MLDIQKIIDWNKQANNNDFDANREIAMYFSEAQETIEGLKSNDVVAVLDGVLDTLWVGIGTLHKMGLNAEQIVQAFEEISRSNYTKIAGGVIRNEQGKIIKPEGYEPPNLLPIVQGR